MAKSKRISDYWEQSRSPAASLVFVLPFLLVYEIGMLTRSDWNSARNGADVWIRQALLQSGISYEWLLPFLVPVILLGWHLFKKEKWVLSYETLSGMFAESLLYAMLMIVLGQLAFRLFPMSVAQVAQPSTSQKILTFLGAGIYEELLFRLMLLPLIYWAMRGLRTPHRWAIIGSVLISCLLFATAHYLDGAGSLFSPSSFVESLRTVIGDSTLWYSFTFRCLAGCVFSVLFWLRGFGITVGCHILYDLIVGVILSGVGTA